VRVWLSAETGAGMELLVQVLVELFASTKVTRRCFLTPQQGGIRAKLFTCAKIIAEDIDELGASELVVQIDVKHLGLLKEVKTEELP
jgi:GTP-binding protein HflX